MNIVSLISWFTFLAVSQAAPGNVISGGKNHGLECTGSIYLHPRGHMIGHVTVFNSSLPRIDHVVSKVHKDGTCCWRLYRQYSYKGRYIHVQRFHMTFSEFKVRSVEKTSCETKRDQPALGLVFEKLVGAKVVSNENLEKSEPVDFQSAKNYLNDSNHMEPEGKGKDVNFTPVNMASIVPRSNFGEKKEQHEDITKLKTHVHDESILEASNVSHTLTDSQSIGQSQAENEIELKLKVDDFPLMKTGNNVIDKAQAETVTEIKIRSDDAYGAVSDKETINHAQAETETKIISKTNKVYSDATGKDIYEQGQAKVETETNKEAGTKAHIAPRIGTIEAGVTMNNMELIHEQKSEDMMTSQDETSIDDPTTIAESDENISNTEPVESLNDKEDNDEIQEKIDDKNGGLFESEETSAKFDNQELQSSVLKTNDSMFDITNSFTNQGIFESGFSYDYYYDLDDEETYEYFIGEGQIHETTVLDIREDTDNSKDQINQTSVLDLVNETESKKLDQKDFTRKDQINQTSVLSIVNDTESKKIVEEDSIREDQIYQTTILDKGKDTHFTDNSIRVDQISKTDISDPVDNSDNKKLIDDYISKGQTSHTLLPKAVDDTDSKKLNGDIITEGYISQATALYPVGDSNKRKDLDGLVIQNTALDKVDDIDIKKLLDDSITDDQISQSTILDLAVDTDIKKPIDDSFRDDHFSHTNIPDSLADTDIDQLFDDSIKEVQTSVSDSVHVTNDKKLVTDSFRVGQISQTTDLDPVVDSDNNKLVDESIIEDQISQISYIDSTGAADNKKRVEDSIKDSESIQISDINSVDNTDNKNLVDDSIKDDQSIQITDIDSVDDTGNKKLTYASIKEDQISQTTILDSKVDKEKDNFAEDFLRDGQISQTEISDSIVDTDNNRLVKEGQISQAYSVVDIVKKNLFVDFVLDGQISQTALLGSVVNDNDKKKLVDDSINDGQSIQIANIDLVDDTGNKKLTYASIKEDQISQNTILDSVTDIDKKNLAEDFLRDGQIDISDSIVDTDNKKLVDDYVKEDQIIQTNFVGPEDDSENKKLVDDSMKEDQINQTSVLDSEDDSENKKIVVILDPDDNSGNNKFVDDFIKEGPIFQNTVLDLVDDTDNITLVEDHVKEGQISQIAISHSINDTDNKKPMDDPSRDDQIRNTSILDSSADTDIEPLGDDSIKEDHTTVLASVNVTVNKRIVDDSVRVGQISQTTDLDSIVDLKQGQITQTTVLNPADDNRKNKLLDDSMKEDQIIEISHSVVDTDYDNSSGYDQIRNSNILYSFANTDIEPLVNDSIKKDHTNVLASVNVTNNMKFVNESVSQTTDIDQVADGDNSMKDSQIIQNTVKDSVDVFDKKKLVDNHIRVSQSAVLDLVYGSNKKNFVDDSFKKDQNSQASILDSVVAVNEKLVVNDFIREDKTTYLDSIGKSVNKKYVDDTIKEAQIIQTSQLDPEKYADNKKLADDSSSESLNNQSMVMNVIDDTDIEKLVAKMKSKNQTDQHFFQQNSKNSKVDYMNENFVDCEECENKPRKSFEVKETLKDIIIESNGQSLDLDSNSMQEIGYLVTTTDQIRNNVRDKKKNLTTEKPNRNEVDTLNYPAEPVRIGYEENSGFFKEYTIHHETGRNPFKLEDVDEKSIKKPINKTYNREKGKGIFKEERNDQSFSFSSSNLVESLIEKDVTANDNNTNFDVSNHEQTPSNQEEIRSFRVVSEKQTHKKSNTESDDRIMLIHMEGNDKENTDKRKQVSSHENTFGIQMEKTNLPETEGDSTNYTIKGQQIIKGKKSNWKSDEKYSARTKILTKDSFVKRLEEFTDGLRKFGNHNKQPLPTRHTKTLNQNRNHKSKQGKIIEIQADIDHIPVNDGVFIDSIEDDTQLKEAQDQMTQLNTKSKYSDAKEESHSFECKYIIKGKLLLLKLHSEHEHDSDESYHATETSITTHKSNSAANIKLGVPGSPQTLALSQDNAYSACDKKQISFTLLILLWILGNKS